MPGNSPCVAESSTCSRPLCAILCALSSSAIASIPFASSTLTINGPVAPCSTLMFCRCTKFLSVAKFCGNGQAARVSAGQMKRFNAI